ncbi:ROK family protein [Microbacterium capsulatum]|uniref:ROK family protein n=1 Tax=Microbacterium capsulatum TaxID=3041921 RepID=A0ABU0XFY6_9MICO|nr:ROK family protein [Microbacterium sp. ASV81]MDQ4213105.1 ROK family protein [Microbacterium sp. ASV81]
MSSADERPLAVGIDIGGTKTAAGLVTMRGEVRRRAEVPTPAADGAEAVLATAARLAAELVDGSADPVSAIGIGAAGVIDPRRRLVLSATDTLPGWSGMRVGDRVETALGLPVAVDNDVRAHAVGEARFGAGRGLSSALVIAAGTGVGGALVLDGHPQQGATGIAGHFGHIPSVEAQGLPCTCGRSGHLEVIASGPAVLAAYRRAGGGGEAGDTRAVFELAEGGDPAALAAIRTAGRALGGAIGGLVNALDPEVVIVTGGLSHTSALWWGPLRDGFGEEAIDLVRSCPLTPAALGADAAIIGAAALAFDLVAERMRSGIPSSAGSADRGILPDPRSRNLGGSA